MPHTNAICWPDFTRLVESDLQLAGLPFDRSGRGDNGVKSRVPGCRRERTGHAGCPSPGHPKKRPRRLPGISAVAFTFLSGIPSKHVSDT